MDKELTRNFRARQRGPVFGRRLVPPSARRSQPLWPYVALAFVISFALVATFIH